MKPTNLTILITGGSSGLGYSTALHFLSLKNKIIILDITPPPQNSPNIHYYKTDITQPSEIQKAFLSIASKSLKIDILLNTAGITSTSLFLPKKKSSK